MNSSFTDTEIFILKLEQEKRRCNKFLQNFPKSKYNESIEMYIRLLDEMIDSLN